MTSFNPSDFTILIVDDLPRNIQVLGVTLKEQNYKLEFATSGTKALEWIEKKEFDLILLDIMMPEMNGYTVCSKLKENPKTENIPILFITAKTDIESIAKGFAVGGVDYITKPFNEKELLARVKTHLELKKHKDKLEELVEERNQQLIKAHEELKVLDKAKTDFLNLLSHEIRTPLNGIKGPLQLLKLRSDDTDLLELVKILDISTERLEYFSYSALLITRLETDKFSVRYTNCNLRKVIDFALLKHNELISEKGLKIILNDFDSDLSILSDEDLLHETIVRILDNAINYSPNKGLIKISTGKEDDNLFLIISDTGKGFPKSFLAEDLKLFKPGEEFVNRNIGISLYLVKLIINNLKGKLILGNTETEGAFVKIIFNSK